MKWAGSGIVQQQTPIKNNCLKCENNLFLMTDLEKAFIGAAGMECTLLQKLQSMWV